MPDRQESQPASNTASPAIGRRVVWFLAGAIPTYVLLLVLTANNAIRSYVKFVFLAGLNFIGFPGPADQGPPWAVSITLDEKGGTLLGELTRKNVPSPDLTFKRHLAILLEGSVMSAPTINSEIRTRAQLSGNFSADELDRLVKTLRGGATLEFRVLANSADDKVAIDDAMKLINGDAADVTNVLVEAQAKGQPPPGLGYQGLGGGPKVYGLVLAHGAWSRVSYSWVKLGPPEQRQLRLDHAYQADAEQNAAWNEAAKFRGKATHLPDTAATAGQKLLQGALFYSREYKAPNPPAEKTAETQVEYYVLARNPEIDPATAKETPKIDGSYLTEASKVSVNRMPFSSFFEQEGFADRLILVILAVIAVLLLSVRRWIHLRREFLIGQWAAMLAGAVVALTK